MKYLENEKLDFLIKFAMYDYYDPSVEEFKNIDDSTVVLSRRYYVKKRRLLNEYRMRPKLLAAKKLISSVSVACLIIVLTIGISIVSVSSLRNAVWNAIVKWYEDYITIRYEIPDDTSSEESDSYAQDSFEDSEDTLQETQTVASVTPPSKIEMVKKPTYLPEGVEEELVMKNSILVLYDYYKGDSLMFSYTQMLYKENEKYFDDESVKISELDINGNVAIVVEYALKNEREIIWNDGQYIYKIFYIGDIFDEIISVAKSIS